MKDGGPALDDALGPETIPHVQHGDRTLVLWAGSPRRLGDHGDIGPQELIRPDPRGLHQVQQSGNPPQDGLGEGLPHRQRNGSDTGRGAFSHAPKNRADALQGPKLVGPAAVGDVKEELGGAKGGPAGRSIHRRVHPPDTSDPIGPNGRIHRLVGATLNPRLIQDGRGAPGNGIPVDCVPQGCAPPSRYRGSTP